MLEISLFAQKQKLAALNRMRLDQSYTVINYLIFYCAHTFFHAFLP